jgi:hypothetical protein
VIYSFWFYRFRSLMLQFYAVLFPISFHSYRIGFFSFSSYGVRVVFWFSIHTNLYHRLQMWIVGKLTVFLCDHQLDFFTRTHKKWEVSNSRMHQNYRILISTSYFTVS